MDKKDKIVIGWIDYGSPSTFFAESMANLCLKSEYEIEQIIVKRGPLVSKNRNDLVYEFMQSTSNWLLMLDADGNFEPETIDKLFAVADADSRPVVAGWQKMFLNPKQLHSTTNLFVMNADATEWDVLKSVPSGCLLSVGALGLGCVLVHRRVFQSLVEMTQHPVPWFKDEFNPETEDWRGEDIHFCALVRNAGFEIQVHTDVYIGHHKSIILNKEFPHPDDPRVAWSKNAPKPYRVELL